MLEAVLLLAGTVVSYVCVRDVNQDLGAKDRVVNERLVSPAFFRFIGSGIPALVVPGAIMGDLCLSGELRFSSRGIITPTRSMPAMRFLGYITLLAGGTFRIWAMRTLGRYFTFQLSIRPGQEVIRSGPYSIVRNPSYSGVHIMAFAFALIMQTGYASRWMSSSFWKVVVALLSTLLPWNLVTRYRIEGEEHMLSEAFGDDWKAYTKEVPYRLVPYVW